MNLLSPRSLRTIVITLVVVGLLVLALGGFLNPLFRVTLSPLVAVQGWISSRYMAIYEFITVPRDVASLRQRNAELEAEVANLQTQVIELQQKQSEAQALFALLNFARAGKRVVLCLDEAQALPPESLEAVRLLSNLETGKRKLLQIVLFGQPELNQRLRQDSARQLNQRIVFHYHLGPLRRDEMEHYVAHRLSVANFAGDALFTRPAINQLYAASGGVPRLVNIIAHKALMLAYGEGRQQIKSRHVRAAAKDTEAARKSSWRWWALAVALLVIIAGAAMWWMNTQ
jgi:Cdc6-like AAA superfamily ATPase